MGCQKGSIRSSQDIGEAWCSSGHQKQGIANIYCTDHMHIIGGTERVSTSFNFVDSMIVKFLLQDDETALHFAASWDHVEVIQTLVDCGAAVDIRNKVYTISALV